MEHADDDGVAVVTEKSASQKCAHTEKSEAGDGEQSIDDSNLFNRDIQITFDKMCVYRAAQHISYQCHLTLCLIGNK